MTLTYKWALVSVITLCTGIWLGQKYASGNSAPSPLEKSQQDSHSTHLKSAAQISSEQIQSQLQLQQHIKQLQTENLQLKQQLQALASPESHTSSSGADNELLSRVQTLELEKQQRKAEGIISWILKSQTADSNFDLNNELLTHFEQEVRDTAWAEQQENYYRHLFSTQEQLQGIALRDAQCRSTQCEITIGISNIEQSNQLLQTISSSLTADGQAVAIMIAADERSGTSKFYISNSENSFDFN